MLKNIDCGYSLEPLRRGGSNEYPQSMFWAEIKKKKKKKKKKKIEFLSENFQFLVLKFSVYLNRIIFVMSRKCHNHEAQSFWATKRRRDATYETEALKKSRKHAYIILTPLKAHFYIVKLGLTGYTLFLLFLLKT